MTVICGGTEGNHFAQKSIERMKIFCNYDIWLSRKLNSKLNYEREFLKSLLCSLEQKTRIGKRYSACSTDFLILQHTALQNCKYFIGLQRSKKIILLIQSTVLRKIPVGGRHSKSHELYIFSGTTFKFNFCSRLSVYACNFYRFPFSSVLSLFSS